jgi:hypothetical protein
MFATKNYIRFIYDDGFYLHLLLASPEDVQVIALHGRDAPIRKHPIPDLISDSNQVYVKLK